jgi:CRISPR-associated protein Cmr6
MYSGTKLLAALERQHQRRSTPDLFKSGEFTLRGRSKVGSAPHPDTETIVAAGEPCGAWHTKEVKKREKDRSGQWQDKYYESRPEDKRNVGDNNQAQVWPELPLYGYIPAASIRGVVRAWAMKHSGKLGADVQRLLGYQTDTEIFPGKIEFLDAFPVEPTKLSLDIVNPQQSFQVFHEGQSTPLSMYSLGSTSGQSIAIHIGIRGTAQAQAADVAQVWEWVQQALNLQGLGGRRAAGYGVIAPPKGYQATAGLPGLPDGYVSKRLKFNLYSQGNAGPDMEKPELRPAHWRGWLRSWLLRFFLGVMSVKDAQYTVAELLGTLEDSPDGASRQGIVSLQMTAGQPWGKQSDSDRFQRFYLWQGSIKLSAPKNIMQDILLPIIRLAVQVGGVGKGWRRPLHRFTMNNGKEAARGCQVIITEQRKMKGSDQPKDVPLRTPLKHDDWQQVYDQWQAAVKQQWPDRYQPKLKPANAEVFSPQTCAVYVVPGPDSSPIDTEDLVWEQGKTSETHGAGMKLIYQPIYKRQPTVGGNAGQGDAHCSWVSIKRLESSQDFQEVVCLFLGAGDPLRSRFLADLDKIEGAQHIFGKKP